jgi:dipeptidyl-peptidase 4
MNYFIKSPLNTVLLLLSVYAFSACNDKSKIQQCVTIPCKTNISKATKNNDNNEPPIPKIFLDINKTATGSYLGSSIKNLKWSPDGKTLTFLKANSKNLTELWAYSTKAHKLVPLVKTEDLVTKVEETDKEKAQRERKRISVQGIVSYIWAPNSKNILFPLSGDLYLFNLKNKTTKRLTNDSFPEMDPSFSPNGKFIAWVKKGNIEVMNIKSKKVKAITKGATKTRFYGLSEFVAQEEMGRYRGYWWSPDSKRIAYLQVDESKVPIRKRIDMGSGGFKIIQQRYPSVGKNNAKVKVLVSSVSKAASKQLSLGKYEYLPRIMWVNSAEVSVQTQNRDQTILNLLICTAKTGKCNIIHKEKDSAWVELHNNLRFIDGGKKLIWSSENRPENLQVRSKIAGKHKRTLLIATRPDKYPLIKPQIIPIFNGYTFNKLVDVDEEAGLIFFTIYGEGGISNLFVSYNYKSQTPLNLNNLKILTPHSAYHSITISPDKKLFLDKWSNVQTSETLAIKDMTGRIVAIIPPVKTADPLISRLPKPSFVKIPLNNGTNVTLNGILFKPRPFNYSRKYPVIIFVYGGPHGHMVTKRASKYNLWNQYLAQQGFYVLTVDGRGGLYKDRAFAKTPYKSIGKFEVEDSLAAVNYLKKIREVDSQRIGIWGWSYGGYTVIASLVKTSGVFAAGLAVAPPTDWTLYDTHYTERYLGLYSKKSKSYSQSLISLDMLKKLSAPLMVVHGMSDDNVLLINSLRIIKGLQDHKLPFEMMLYPGKAHSLWGNSTRSHLIGQITSFFITHLKPFDRVTKY